MGTADRKLTILMTADCGADRSAVLRCLSGLHQPAAVSVVEADALNALFAESPPDALILSAEHFDLAVSLAARSASAILLMCRERSLNDLRAACICAGFLLCTADDLPLCLPALAASAVRLRAMRQQTHTLRRQLDDTRMVTRAKLLLMSRLQMSEEEAHRYIEKTAMDTSQSRREIAQRIIRTYE